MFLVLNKEKICAYVVSVLTVCFLFFIAKVNTDKVVETSSNSIQVNNVQENNVKENNVIANNIVK